MVSTRGAAVGFAVAPTVSARRGWLSAPAAGRRPAPGRAVTPAVSPAPAHRRCTRVPGPTTTTTSTTGATTTTTASAAPQTAAPPRLTLNTGDNTTITVALPPSAVAPLGSALNTLLASFKAVAAAAAEGKRDKQPVMEFMHEEGGLRVAMECNPNLHQSAFKATVYVKVESGGVVVASQALLTRLVDNVKQFKAAVKASQN